MLDTMAAAHAQHARVRKALAAQKAAQEAWPCIRLDAHPERCGCGEPLPRADYPLCDACARE
jgi:hypothetical protein